MFFFKPPIGNTRPRSVISPVIPTSLLTGIPVSAEISAVAIVIPADGPSLELLLLEHEYEYHFFMEIRINLKLFCTRTNITKRRLCGFFHNIPKFPVKINFPLPGATDTSIASVSPPAAVYAKPVAIPTWSVFQLAHNGICAYQVNQQRFSLLLQYAYVLL